MQEITEGRRSSLRYFCNSPQEDSRFFLTLYNPVLHSVDIKRQAKPDAPVCFRATAKERQMLDWLIGQLGLNTSAVLKLAIRRLYAKEGGKPIKD